MSSSGAKSTFATYAGVLGADVAVADSVVGQVILTTPVLPVGTYIVAFGCTYVATNSPPSNDVEFFVTVGTATASFNGPQNSSAVSSAAGLPISTGYECEVTITVAGTLTFEVSAGTNGAGTVKHVSGLSGLPNTGWTAIEVS